MARRLGIIGAGAAGALTAIHAAHRASRSGEPLQITLIDPRPDTGRGVAYSTGDGRHLLNVPVRNMTAFASHPDDFLEWLASKGLEAAGCDFMPRRIFGDYLADTFSYAASLPGIAVTRVMDHAISLEMLGSGLRVMTSRGSSWEVDALVLATGQHDPDSSWAPTSLLESGRLIRDPWSGDALSAVPRDGDVLCVGSGLTMVDVAISLDRAGRVVHACSRRGLLPYPHRAGDPPRMEAPDIAERHPSLSQLREAIAAHLQKSRDRYGDWRPGFDSLRGLTAHWWSNLADSERRDFLDHDARAWHCARHRMAPETDRRFSRMRAEGRVLMHTAGVASAQSSADGVVVRLTNDETLNVAAVIDCTGPLHESGFSRDPMLRSLLTSGLARPGPLALGVDTAPDGRLLGARGAAPIFAIGALRRGNLWETTAIPEIRAQAEALSFSLLGAPLVSSNVDLVP